MRQVDVYPFAAVGTYSGEPYPDWIRDLKTRNGIYVIREYRDDTIAYVGESHSDRLYGTLTRHFQRWTEKYDTAGPTYDREDVEVAVVLVPKTHALYLQNDLICALDPRDNRLVCGEIYETYEAYEADDAEPEYPNPDAIDEDAGAIDAPPRGYDYDIPEILDGIFYRISEPDEPDEEIPF